jgi:hypothetical protein
VFDEAKVFCLKMAFTYLRTLIFFANFAKNHFRYQHMEQIAKNITNQE